MLKVCNFCGNKNFRIKSTQYIYRHNNQFLIVNNVPCEECEYCGEQYFRAEVLKEIEKDFIDIYSANKSAKEKIRVPVDEFAELNGSNKPF